MEFQALVCPTCGFPAPEIVQQQHFKCPACGSLLSLVDEREEVSITCAGCQAVNAAARSFCAGCGAKLRQSCPFCYAANAVGARNCAQCGVNLLAAQRRKQNWLEENARNTEARLALTRKVQDESELGRMQELLNDLDEPANHSFAIYCLTQMGMRAGRALVETLETDPDADARFGAAIALGNIGNVDAVPALCQALGDPEPAVRYWAIDALEKFGPAAAAPVQGCANDRHRGVRERARQALRALGMEMPKSRSSIWPF